MFLKLQVSKICIVQGLLNLSRLLKMTNWEEEQYCAGKVFASLLFDQGFQIVIPPRSPASVPEAIGTPSDSILHQCECCLLCESSRREIIRPFFHSLSPQCTFRALLERGVISSFWVAITYTMGSGD